MRGLTPVWSPDGQRLAFVRADPARIVDHEGIGIDLYVANADGTGEERLYQSQQTLATVFLGLEAIHAWSQDSQELLITVMPIRENMQNIEIHLMDIGSGKSKMVSDKIVNPAWYFLRKDNPSDINNDGLINIFDLVAVASQFGQSGENLDGDVNGDGTVNIFDLILVAAHFGE